MVESVRMGRSSGDRVPQARQVRIEMKWDAPDVNQDAIKGRDSGCGFGAMDPGESMILFGIGLWITPFGLPRFVMRIRNEGFGNRS